MTHNLKKFRDIKKSIHPKLYFFIQKRKLLFEGFFLNWENCHEEFRPIADSNSSNNKVQQKLQTDIFMGAKWKKN